MATITLYYADIKDAYQAAASAASKSTSYAEELTKKVTKKLGSLTGGSTGYTENAAYFAKTKIAQLEERADRYNSYHDQLESFLSDAKSADSGVASYMKNKGTVSTGFAFLEGWIPDAVFDCLTALQTGLRRFFASAEVTVKSWIQDIKEWYNTGNHKYYVAAGLGVLAIAGGVFSVISGWAAITAAAGSISTVGATAAGVTTAKAAASAILGEIAIANGFSQLATNIAATVVSNYSEYAAEGLSELTTASDILRNSYEYKKTMSYWDYVSQTLAAGFDAATIVATVVNVFGSLYNSAYQFLDKQSYKAYVEASETIADAFGVSTSSTLSYESYSQYEALKSATTTDKSLIEKIVTNVSSWGGTLKTTVESGWQEAVKEKIKSVLKSKITIYSAFSSIDSKFNSDQSTWETIKSNISDYINSKINSEEEASE